MEDVEGARTAIEKLNGMVRSQPHPTSMAS
jgi:hypothetical protein